MSAAYLKGAQQQPPQAAISYDHFHVAALMGKAMDEVRATEFKARPIALARALGELDRAGRRCLGHAHTPRGLERAAHAGDVHLAEHEPCKAHGPSV